MFNPTFTAFPTKVPNKIRVVAEGMLGTSEMVLPMTLDEFKAGMVRRMNGELIQNVFPKQTKEVREFLISGMSLNAQDRVFREDEG